MDIHAVLDLYNDAWGETDEPRRRALLTKAWSDEGVYTDPTTVAQGREQLIALMGELQQQFPGMRIEKSSHAEEHNGAFMYTWDLCVGDDVVISGRDIGFRDDDGRVRNLSCFYMLTAQESDEAAAISAS